MPIDTGIYGQIQQHSPFEAINQFQQANLLRTQNDAAQQNLIGAKQEFDDNQKLRELYARPGFDPTSSSSLPAIFAVSPKAGASAQKSMLDAQKTQAEVGHLNAQTTNQTSEATARDYETTLKRKQEHLKEVVSIDDVPSAVAWAQAGVKAGEFTQDQADQLTARLRAGQVDLPSWKQKVMKGGLNAQQQFALEQQQAQLAETSRHNMASEADTRRGQDVTASTARYVQGQETARSGANIVKDYKVAGLDANGNDVAGDTSLSPAAIENAAARYNVDGTMPTNIGRGAQGARDLRKIQNRAAELALGVDPTQVRVNQLDAKSASGALTQITKAKTMAGAFEQTANANADLALSLSKKNDRTGIPMLNAGLQAWRTGTGSPEATQFAAANETFVNEYAKIMSGGMGNGPVSDSARNKAHDLLTTAMTPQQYEGNVKLLQREMRNRMKGFEDQEAAVRKRIGGGGASAPSGAAGGTVPADIQALLDKHKGP